MTSTQTERHGLAVLLDAAILSYGPAVVVAADRAGIIPLLLRHPDEGLTTTEISDALGLNPAVASTVLPILRQYHVVNTTPTGAYVAGELGARHLDPRDADNYGGDWLTFFAQVNKPGMDRLTEHLTGAVPLTDVLYHDQEALMEAHRAYAPLSSAAARAFVEQVDLTSCRRLLDVGAGPAAFTIATLRTVPEATATAVDLPSVVDYTRVCVEKAGLTDRVQVTAADMRTDELPTGYDTVFVNNVFHAWDAESRAGGLSGCLRALDSGGTLYICEHMRENDPPDDDGPEVATLLGLLLLQTGQGTSYTTTDFADAVRAAGFVDVDVDVVPFPRQVVGSHILSARKP